MAKRRREAKIDYMISITIMVVPISNTTRLTILFEIGLMDICGLTTFNFYHK
jgi:hypothetical protein